MFLIFDTETTGLPKRWNSPITDHENWPRCVQIAWQLHDEMGNCLEHQDFLIKPEGFNIPYDAERIHGISTQLASKKGLSLVDVLSKFNDVLAKSKFVVGQNVGFDINVLGCEYDRFKIKTLLNDLPVLDTCTEKTASLCKLPGGRGGKFKLPTLTELHQHLFNESFAEAHNATADVEATSRCFLELVRLGFYSSEELQSSQEYLEKFKIENINPIPSLGLTHINLKNEANVLSELLKEQAQDINLHQSDKVLDSFKNSSVVQLHNHSQFSILQSTISIKKLVDATSKAGMSAVALTDHGNLMGAFHFVKEVKKHNQSILNNVLKPITDDQTFQSKPIKPIIGCEFFVCEDHTNKSHKDNGYQIVFLAKNKKGYENLVKMSSLAFTKGFYYVPRIDRSIIENFKDDLIVLSGNLNGEVSSKLLNVGEIQAEDALLWWKDLFGDDFYLELMRHGQEDEDRINPVLLKFSKKHNISVVATNNTYYIDKSEANAHDILLCVKDGEKQSTPIGRGRGYRYGLPNQEYYFKNSSEMKELFKDIPESIINMGKISDKVESFDLARDVLLPKFDIPSKFINDEDEVKGTKHGENAYLRYLTFEGAKKRYKVLTDDLTERINFELKTIEKTGYPGYFLIVEDFIREARRLGVSVGPGRGSAAGSVVAYCLWITNIDPVKYNLLFERFLNPDRVSMPDIDIDFDDEGRSKVMDYVIKKYGSNQVAQIITYGTMAAKSSIRDTARVLDLPLMDADRLAKLIPNMTKLNKIFDVEEKILRQNFKAEDMELINQLLNISQGDNLEAETINQAKVLEGSLRNTGIHACGVIITPSDITNYVPIATAKDSDLYVTQFDNAVVEDAGLLKMDFLGLKTLTLIKDTVKIIKAKHGLLIDPENFPLDDKLTYELFQKGETVGIFQYESPGMQKHMRDLKPTVFADLIAMNALYRPGPLEYIPSFIKRKHGEEPISYDLPEMEIFLEETYGITVYQEQVMLLSQKLADFTKGEADILRKAMGKKQKSVLDKMKPKFINQASAKGLNTEKLEKIWTDWEKFASYAFNKSHSTCYAWIAYQTAYLKAHYPAEYMASVLSNNMNDIKQVTFFMEEAKRMKINVLGPDINESYYKFSVNKANAIRFGMGAVKGVGYGAVKTIVNERKNNGQFKSIFDLAKRIDLRAANKKAFENLANSGSFDCFINTHRAQYFHHEGDGVSFLEKTLKYAHRFQDNQNSAQVSLFGESSSIQFPEPEIPPCEAWGTMEKLAREREVVGIYISGHPLDDFKIEMQNFCNGTVSSFQNLEQLINKEITFGGVITDVEHRVSRQGKGWASFTVEDYTDNYEFKIFGEEYLKFRHFLMLNNFVYVRCVVRDGWINRDTGKKSTPRLQFNGFQLLHDVINAYAKKLSVQLNIKSINKEKISELKELFKVYKGNQPLNFLIYDDEESIKLNLMSRKEKIKITQELLADLDSKQVFYKLN